MYKITTNSFGQTVIIKVDGDIETSFLEGSETSDYQEYLAWLEEGNTPEPAEEGAA